MGTPAPDAARGSPLRIAACVEFPNLGHGKTEQTDEDQKHSLLRSIFQIVALRLYLMLRLRPGEPVHQVGAVSSCATGDGA